MLNRITELENLIHNTNLSDKDLNAFTDELCELQHELNSYYEYADYLTKVYNEQEEENEQIFERVGKKNKQRLLSIRKFANELGFKFVDYGDAPLGFQNDAYIGLNYRGCVIDIRVNNFKNFYFIASHHFADTKKTELLANERATNIKELKKLLRNFVESITEKETPVNC